VSRSSTSRFRPPGSDLRRWPRRVGALALLVVFAAPAAAALDRAGVVALGASVLRVETMRDGGGSAFGSAVSIAADTVVTNCHVTRDARAIHVVFAGTRRSVAAQTADLDRDLCLLQVPGLGARSVPLGRSADLRVGQAVTAFGYTGGVSMQASAGEVVGLHPHDGARVIQASNRFSSGASGGGLFDDDGRLVGILTFRLRGSAAHYYAAPAEWLQRLLAGPDAWQAVAPLATDRLPYWQLPSDLQPAFLRAAAQPPGHAPAAATEMRP
jgi:serine protease Do